MFDEPARDEDSPPPIETEPPWSGEFLAALHAGCYDDESVTDPTRDPMAALWARVRADPVAAHELDLLDEICAELARLNLRLSTPTALDQ